MWQLSRQNIRRQTMSQQFFVKGNASRLITKQVSGTGITAIDETGKKIKTSPEVNMHFAIKKDFFFQIYLITPTK